MTKSSVSAAMLVAAGILVAGCEEKKPAPAPTPKAPAPAPAPSGSTGMTGSTGTTGAK